MTEARFTLSAFGDEIAVKLHDQLAVLADLQIGFLELRTVWGKNVLDLDDDEARKVASVCAAADVGVSAIGSPIGKSPITEPMADELRKLDRILRIAEIVGTRRIRIFSYYPPDISTNARYDEYVEVAAERLAQLADHAAPRGYTLLLENEKEIVGDAIERCATILRLLKRANVSFVWDPANFVQVGESRVTERGWPSLGDHVGYVHIKDARLADGSVHAAGEGDGQVPELLTILRETGYQGFLALEPHLAVAGHSNGFSGPEGMAYAVQSLRRVMAQTGCVEVNG
ncbi:sugar phosphate isomerase/epimerase family protein [Caldilinea sp.]|uniref:sugar phosphate isomerase/epimerase family protein n=1 Tax=Caldilinea sp. TaxID=2293560 RepID=UPI002B5CF20E|nr:sugar phosphate isomerase/epimerase [Anaerolineales bacterium]HQY94992.1 sugar phosphate isomerase/epimerase family protein [Caldilinea sp.]HRA66552.1 sugar phosphate isomerase/epimerase family protein [Caldilinea sp.]